MDTTALTDRELDWLESDWRDTDWCDNCGHSWTQHWTQPRTCDACDHNAGPCAEGA